MSEAKGIEEKVIRQKWQTFFVQWATKRELMLVFSCSLQNGYGAEIYKNGTVYGKMAFWLSRNNELIHIYIPEILGDQIPDEESEKVFPVDDNNIEVHLDKNFLI